MAQIYIIGIGGAGTSALALLLHEQGHTVSGVDTGDGFYTRDLTARGISVHTTFDAAHIAPTIDRVIYSTAVPADNVELRAAQAVGMQTMTYPEALGEFTRTMRTIAVCGTHGKTTTTGLTTHALVGAGMNPSAIVGAQVVGWNGGARVGGGEVLVIEADEYQNKLALYEPFGVILTSVDYDHPDFFPSPDAYRAVFADFVARVPQDGFIVACGDHADVRAVVASAQCRTVFYGTAPTNDCVVTARTLRPDGMQEVAVQYDGMHHTLVIRAHGAHNALNAAAAWVASSMVSGDVRGSAAGLADFAGIARRCESHGVYNGAVLLDDYAHHPAEIAATIAGVRETYPDKKLTVAFHPHTFTRTQALLADFAVALAAADCVIVLDIYGSARERGGTVHAMDLVNAINAIVADCAHYVADVDALAAWMRTTLTADDVCVTMGAGDIWKVYSIISNLE